MYSVQPYAEHFHSGFSLGLILDGHTRFSLRDSVHEAVKDDIVLIGPGLPHSCNPIDGQPRSYHMAYFDAQWFADNILGRLGLPENWAIVRPVVRDAALFQEAREILHDFCNCRDTAPQRFAHFFARMQAAYACIEASTASPSAHAEFSRVMEEAVDACPQHSGETGTANAARRNAFQWGQKQTRRQMQNHMQGRAQSAVPETRVPDLWLAPVSRLARKAGLRRESFSRAFHRHAGLSPKVWLHCLRLEKGRMLLREGKSIAEAALAVGYADQSHFHRMFVKYFSVTPGCYQRGTSHSYKTRK